MISPVRGGSARPVATREMRADEKRHSISSRASHHSKFEFVDPNPASRSLSFTAMPTHGATCRTGPAMAGPARDPGHKGCGEVFSVGCPSGHRPPCGKLWANTVAEACRAGSLQRTARDTEHGAGGLGTTMVNSLQEHPGKAAVRSTCPVASRFRPMLQRIHGLRPE